MSGGTQTRVLYSFPHELGRPGIATTALNHVLSLDRAGAAVTVVCTTTAVPLPPSIEVHETLRLGPRRIPHRAVGGTDRAYAYHDWRVARLLKRRANDYDVVHAWPLASLLTSRTARRQGVAAFRELPNGHTRSAYAAAATEAQTYGVAQERQSSHTWNERRLRRETAEYREALLLAPSDHVVRTFVDQGVPAGRIRRHRYGFDPEQFHPDDARRDRPFVAIFVGSGEPRKGLHFALEAWRDIPDRPADAVFRVAGRIQPGYRAALASHLDDPSVELLGFRSDVPDLLRDADVLVLPSVEEGSALVVYEAIGSGCVPLVSAATGAAFESGAAGLIHETRNVGQLREHFALVVSDRDRLAQLRAGTLRAAPQLTWDAAGRDLLSVYRAAIAEAH